MDPANQQKPIDAVMELLDKRSMGLTDTVGQLEARLQPCMSPPEQPATAKADGTTPGQSPLAIKLGGIAVRIGESQQRLDLIMNRLQL